MAEIDQLATALNLFQAEVVTVGKGKQNPFFKSKYAPLDQIMSAALPVLTKHGLAVAQLVTHIEGATALETVLMHKSGQQISSVMPLLLPKEDPQGQGSAITYARRYSYAAVLGIVIDEDDDGNRASQPQTPAQAGAKYSAPKPAAASSLASSAQRGMIAGLMKQQGIPQDEMKGFLISELGIADPEKMTSEQARFAIDELKSSSKTQPTSLS